MAYWSNVYVETSEGPTARLRRLATLRKRKQRTGVTEEKLRGREQKQRDLDESEQEARLMKKRKQMKEYRDKETSLRRLELMRKNAKKRLQREDSEDLER